MNPVPKHGRTAMQPGFSQCAESLALRKSTAPDFLYTLIARFFLHCSLSPPRRITPERRVIHHSKAN